MGVDSRERLVGGDLLGTVGARGVKGEAIDGGVHDHGMWIAGELAFGLFIVVLRDVGRGAAGEPGNFTGAFM